MFPILDVESGLEPAVACCNVQIAPGLIGQVHATSDQTYLTLLLGTGTTT